MKFRMAETLKKDYQIRFCGEWLEDAYCEYMECSNCGKKEEVFIRKGILKKDMPDLVCHNCGCKTLKII